MYTRLEVLIVPFNNQTNSPACAVQLRINNNKQNRMRLVCLRALTAYINICMDMISCSVVNNYCSRYSVNGTSRHR
jgi:hypothetical protein